MKVIKSLILISLICSIGSILGINAKALEVQPMSTFDNYLFFSVDIPGYNGFTTTARRTKNNLGQKQAIRNAYTAPSYDDVDVILKRVFDNGNVANASGWKVIASSGADIILNNQDALYQGTYYLYFDSRAHYTKHTISDGVWYLDDNK